jgi:predicted SAM-dependent methyltransferase
MKRTLWNRIKALFGYIRILPGVFPQYAVKVANSFAYHMYFFRITNRQFEGLNLGCGYSRIKNFCNIDANLRAHCDVVAGIYKIKLSSNSVGAIYNSHVFEHIPREKAIKVLAVWYRVIKTGGKIYICVPDLEVLFRAYLDNLPFYNTEKGRYIVDRACYLMYGGQGNKYDFHFYGYSFATLRNLLESVGFKNVNSFSRESDFSFSPPQDISTVRFQVTSTIKMDDLPWSLNIEAQK